MNKKMPNHRSGFKTTPEAGKPQVRLKSKPATITADKAQADEKAESAKAIWRMSSTF
jgi:hypothetical protein